MLKRALIGSGAFLLLMTNTLSTVAQVEMDEIIVFA